MATIFNTKKIAEAINNNKNKNSVPSPTPPTYPGMLAGNNTATNNPVPPPPSTSTAQPPKINNTFTSIPSPTPGGPTVTPKPVPSPTPPTAPISISNPWKTGMAVPSPTPPKPPVSAAPAWGESLKVPAPPSVNNAATGSASMPSTGYGGATYGTNAATNKALEANTKYIADPANRQSEIDRTLKVIAERQAAGMDISAQNKYLRQLGYNGKKESSVVPDPAGPGTFTFVPPTQSSESQVPIYNPALPVRDEAALRKYVNDQYDRKLSDLRLYADQQTRAGQTIADQQLAANQTQYDRAQQTLGENRALENTYNARNLSPFSGRSDYAQGMIAQERGRTDREAQQDFATRQANINADLSNLRNSIEEKYAAMQNAAPAEKEALYQQILNDERMYDLAINGQQIEGLMANSQLNNTAFNQALQAFNTNRGVFESDRQFGLQEDALMGQRNGQSTLAGKQANWNAYMDMVNQTGNLGKGPAQNWSNIVNNANAGAQTMQGAQWAWQRDTDKRDYDRGVYESDRNYNRGVLESDRGYNRGNYEFDQTMGQRRDEFQSGVDQDLYKMLYGNNGANKAPGTADISQNINRAISGLDGNLDPSTPEGQRQIESMIITQTQDPAVAIQLYNMYGIPIPKELQDLYNNSLKSGQ